MFGPPFRIELALPEEEEAEEEEDGEDRERETRSHLDRSNQSVCVLPPPDE